MDIEYYAIFNYDEYDSNGEKYGISISFPDIPEAVTCARNDKEGLNMASEVLQLVLIKDNGAWPEMDSLPVSTPLDQIELGQNEKAILIKYKTQDINMKNFQFFS